VPLLEPGTVAELTGGPVAWTGTHLVLAGDTNFDEWLLADGRGLVGVDLRRTTGLTQIGIAGSSEPGGPALIEGNRAGGGLSGDSRIIGRIDDDGSLLWERNLGRSDDTPASVEGISQGVAVIKPETGELLGLDVADGRQLWSVPAPGGGRNLSLVGFSAGSLIVEATGTSPFETIDVRTGQTRKTSAINPQPSDDRSDSTPDHATAYLLDGDTLVQEYSDGDHPTLARHGRHPWEVGNGGTTRSFAVGYSQERVVVAGPSGDLVLLDALTGAQIGAAVPHTQLPAYSSCAADRVQVVFVTDDEVAVGCGHTGDLVRFTS